jgi:hypothetical protein
LPEGEGFLMAPVLRGMIGYHDVIEPGLRLEDFCRMNDALAVEAENTARIREAQAAAKER